MVVFLFVVMAIVGLGVPLLMVRHAMSVLRRFAQRAGWESAKFDWFMLTMESRWQGRPVSFLRVRRRSRLRLAEPSAVTLHVTGKDDWLARLNDAFRADVIEVEPSAFRFYGDAAALAVALNNDDAASLAMHEALRGGAELIIDRDGISVTAQSGWLDTPDAAWRLIVAVDRCVNPARQAV